MFVWFESRSFSGGNFADALPRERVEAKLFRWWWAAPLRHPALDAGSSELTSVSSKEFFAPQTRRSVMPGQARHEEEEWDLRPQHHVVRIERALADDFGIIEVAENLDLELRADGRMIWR